MHFSRLLNPSLALAAALAACWATGAAAVAAPPPAGQPVDGIRCDSSEGAVMHIHQHLTILDHGRPHGVPEDVGRPFAGQCFYWLHTHTPDGIIHIEAPAFRSFTLGNFFDVWGEPLSRSDVAGARPRKGEHVAVWVDGRPYTGDVRAIELTAHLDVTFDVGPPYRKPSPFTDWRGQ